MLKRIKKKIDEYIQQKAREMFEEEEAPKKNKSDFVAWDGDSKLAPEQASELLKLSFQRTPADSFKIIKNGKTYAMDSVAGCKTPEQYGLNGIGQNIIYTFFAKHGFIGWQLCALLSQHWLIHRACTIPNQDAMAPGWENVFEKERPGEYKEADQKILSDLYQKSEQKYHLTKKCCEFGNNRKIFGISIAFPVIEGVDPYLPFNIDAVKPGSYKGIAIVEPYWCLPSWTEAAMSEPGNLNFYQPEYYSFPYNGKVTKVHRSNLIISTHGEVPDLLKPSYYFGGIPLPQMVYERVYAAEKVANEAPLLALTKRLLVADANMEQVYLNPEESKKKIDRLVNFRDNSGVWFKNPGDQLTQIDTSLMDFDQLIMTQYQIVAGIVDIPMFKLMGSNFKGMNPTGEGELKNYVQSLQDLQVNVFKPLIERHNLLSMKSDFDSAEMVSIKFNPVDMPTEKELAEVEALKAQTDTAYVNSGILTPEEVRAKVAADRSNSYNSLSEELPADLDLEEGAFHESDLPKQIFAHDEWKESDHPRDDDGKFTSQGGSGKKATSSSEKKSKKPAPRNTMHNTKGYRGGAEMSHNAQAAYKDGLIDETEIDFTIEKLAPKATEEEKEALKKYFYSEWHHVGEIDPDDPSAAEMNFYDVERFKYGDHLADVSETIRYRNNEELKEFAKQYGPDDVVDVKKLGEIVVSHNKQEAEKRQKWFSDRNKLLTAIKENFADYASKKGVDLEKQNFYDYSIKQGKIKSEEKNADISFKLKGKDFNIKDAYFYEEWVKGDKKLFIYDKKGGNLIATRSPNSVKMENVRYTDDYKEVGKENKRIDNEISQLKAQLIADNLNSEVKNFLSSFEGWPDTSRSGNIYKSGELPRSKEIKEGLQRLTPYRIGDITVDYILQENRGGEWVNLTQPQEHPIEFDPYYIKDVKEIIYKK